MKRCFAAGRYSEALARFEAALSATPNDLVAAVGVAKSKLLMERPDDAVKALRALNQANPEVGSGGLLVRPFARIVGREGEGARRVRGAAQEASERASVVDVYVAASAASESTGADRASEGTLAKASAALPSSPAIHRALGELALGEGRHVEAEREFQQALALDSGDLAARFKLAVAERRQGSSRSRPRPSIKSPRAIPTTLDSRSSAVSCSRRPGALTRRSSPTSRRSQRRRTIRT